MPETEDSFVYRYLVEHEFAINIIYDSFKSPLGGLNFSNENDFETNESHIWE